MIYFCNTEDVNLWRKDAWPTLFFKLSQKKIFFGNNWVIGTAHFFIDLG